MYTCPSLTLVQQQYCTYKSYVYNESKALTQIASTSLRRVEPASTRVERSISPRGEGEEDRRRLRFSDTRHPRVLRRNGDQGGKRHSAQPVLALPPAEPEIPAPVLDATA